MQSLRHVIPTNTHLTALLAEISSAIQVHLKRHGKAIRRISATPPYERSKKRTTERKIRICVKFSNCFVFIYLSAVILLSLHVSIQLYAIQPKGQKYVCHLCIAYNLVTRGMSRSTTDMHTPLNAYVCVCDQGHGIFSILQWVWAMHVTARYSRLASTSET